MWRRFGRRAVVAFTTDWAEDAMRRDFTINALYAAADGTLFDYFGGLDDISARRVRFIGDARQQNPGRLSSHPSLLPLLRLVWPG